MSIVTKNGDDGYTDIAGERVRKDSSIIQFIGQTDYIISRFVLLSAKYSIDEFEIIVEDLVQMSAIAADYLHTESFTEHKVAFLENRIKFLERPLDKFIYPFDNVKNAELNVLRAEIRTLERIAFSTFESREGFSIILKYLNRLADYIFAHTM